MATVPKPLFGTCFEGILVDTGAAKASSAGVIQYDAYCRYVGESLIIADFRAAVCHFEIGSVKSQGMAPIAFLDDSIVDSDTHILLSVNDMDRIGIYFNNLEDKVVHTSSVIKSKIIRKCNHSFLILKLYTSCMLTSVDLQRIHHRFDDQSTEKLINLFKRPELPAIGPYTRRTLEKIELHFDPCQTYTQKSRRFKLTLRDNKVSNHTICPDIFYIGGNAIFHVFDEATNFQSAKWLKVTTTETLWETLRLCRIDVYLGSPDVIAHNSGKTFMAPASQANADMLHIKTKSILVESANSMTIIER